MSEEGVLRISNPEDREKVAVILFKNGYTVVRKKRKVGKKIEYDLSYKEEEEEWVTE